MTHKTFLLFCCLCNFTLFGQRCVDRQLSGTFAFDTKAVFQSKEKLGPCKITVAVSDRKTNEKIQTVEINSEFILPSKSFKNCDANRSYSTGKNLKLPVVENDFGNLIIADFNFDGKEDFAVKREEGGNGGPLYNFYLQTDERKFALDEFLSNKMMWFPSEINKTEMTLTTRVRANASEDEKVTYNYSAKKKKWKITNRQTIAIDKTNG